jgi:hypothetical protein
VVRHQILILTCAGSIPATPAIFLGVQCETYSPSIWYIKPQTLFNKISEFLDVPLVNPQIRKFANGEIFCEIEKNVRGADVFVMQS